MTEDEKYSCCLKTILDNEKKHKATINKMLNGKEYWYEVNIVDTILLIKVDNYEDFLKYSVGDKYPSLFCILSLLYQPSMNSNIASFVSS